MIKVYFDWNVISQMKNGFHEELKKIIVDNPNLFIAYSTSHIQDILSSFNTSSEQQKLIESDLAFISELTKNRCVFNSGKDIILEFREPKELFLQSLEDKEAYKDLSLDGLFKPFENDEVLGPLMSLMKNLMKNMPLEPLFKEAFENPKSAEQMNRLFPGLKNNFTMEGFFKCFSDMNVSMNEDEHYKELRQILQGNLGINRDKVYDSKEPYGLIEKLHFAKNLKLQKTEAKNSPQWHSDIIDEYILLDMHGYQEDNVNVKKGRKETFRNTSEDATHSAFASMFNFYVINDKKSYKKAKAVYQKLGVNTIVLNPDEFVKHFNDYIHLPNAACNITMPYAIAGDFDYHEDKLENATLRTYYFPYFFYYFFNKLLILVPDDKDEEFTVLLSQNMPTNGRTYVMEIRQLVEEINQLWGRDQDGYGEIKDEEFNASEWKGRTWKLNGLSIRLRQNGYIQLYLDYSQNANIEDHCRPGYC